MAKPKAKVTTSRLVDVLDELRGLLLPEYATGDAQRTVTGNGLTYTVTLKVRAEVTAEAERAYRTELVEFLKSQPWSIHGGRCDCRKEQFSSSRRSCSKRITYAIRDSRLTGAAQAPRFVFACTAHVEKFQGPGTQTLALAKHYVDGLIAAEEKYRADARNQRLCAPYDPTVVDLIPRDG